MPIPLFSTPPVARLTRPDYLREAMLRSDRVARDEAVDRPEIEESYRVSLSDEGLLEAAAPTPDGLRRDPASELSLQAARAIASYGSIARL